MIKKTISESVEKSKLLNNSVKSSSRATSPSNMS